MTAIRVDYSDRKIVLSSAFEKKAFIPGTDEYDALQSNLGHATAAFTLDVYGHVTDEMKRDSADRMESYMKTLSES